MVVNRFSSSLGMLRQENGDSEVPLYYKEKPISKKNKNKTNKSAQKAKFKVILGYRVSW